MTAIEFSAQAGKTFSVQLYNATTGAAIGSAITGVTDATTPTLYRASTGTNTGIVYVVATGTNVRGAGYANLDAPGANGYSPVLGSYDEAVGGGGSASVVVMPLQLEQRERQLGNDVKLKTRETPMAVFDVLPDENGDIPNLNTLTLEVKIQTINQATTLTIPNGSITRDVTIVSGTVTAASVMFRWPSGLTTDPGEWEWALRETANNSHLAGGLVTVTHAP